MRTVAIEKISDTYWIEAVPHLSEPRLGSKAGRMERNHDDRNDILLELDGRCCRLEMPHESDDSSDRGPKNSSDREPDNSSDSELGKKMPKS